MQRQSRGRRAVSGGAAGLLVAVLGACGTGSGDGDGTERNDGGAGDGNGAEGGEPLTPSCSSNQPGEGCAGAPNGEGRGDAGAFSAEDEGSVSGATTRAGGSGGVDGGGGRGGLGASGGGGGSGGGPGGSDGLGGGGGSGGGLGGSGGSGGGLGASGGSGGGLGGSDGLGGGGGSGGGDGLGGGSGGAIDGNEPSVGGGAGATGHDPTGGGETGGGETGGGETGGGETGGGAGDSSGGGHPLQRSCEASVSLYDTSAGLVVGDGTATHCTESALRDAVAQGGIVTFDCGSDPVTIELTETIELPTDRDTIIDGGGLVTLDAGGRTRHFHFESGDWMVTQTKIVFQRLIFRNGKAPAGEYFPPVDRYPECAYGYKEGSGGAIYVRDGVLQVIDCDFYDNEAALVGPDVGGGAIYALGASGVVISGSRFVGNRAANGGAVGMLYANPEIYNSLFEDNTAEGTGMNRAVSEEECPAEYEFGHPNQAGAGGLAGGVYFDGANDEDHTYVICGSVFRNNRCNELGGALFRTPNVGMRSMRIQDSVFDANTATGGGVSFIKQNDVLVSGSLFVNNRSGLLVDGTDSGGWASGLWINEGSVALENTTFIGNDLDVDGGGTLTNATLVASGLNGDYTVRNSLFVDQSCDGTQPGNHNVQWPSGTACAEGTAFADPELGELADNGGPTWTLMPGNPAAVAGVGQDCPAADQRGEPRDTSACAAGAVEP